MSTKELGKQKITKKVALRQVEKRSDRLKLVDCIKIQMN